MIAFEKLRGRTFCPFARKAKIRYARAWDEGISYAANVRNQAIDLKQFVNEQNEFRAHGYVSEIRIGSRAMRFETVKLEFAKYIRELSSHDTSCFDCLQQSIIDREWQFTFNSGRLFLNVFAPCYAAKHSKYIEDESAFYIFFQPEGSFDLCGIDSSSIATKQSIRSSFAVNGSGYSAELIEARIEAAIYMFPMSTSDDPVDWWVHLQ